MTRNCLSRVYAPDIIFVALDVAKGCLRAETRQSWSVQQRGRKGTLHYCRVSALEWVFAPVPRILIFPGASEGAQPPPRVSRPFYKSKTGPSANPLRSRDKTTNRGRRRRRFRG